MIKPNKWFLLVDYYSYVNMVISQWSGARGWGWTPLENKIKSRTRTRGNHKFSRISGLKSRSQPHFFPKHQQSPKLKLRIVKK